jgi:hypothetical protein
VELNKLSKGSAILYYVEGAAASLRAESYCFLLFAGLSFVMMFYKA